MTRAIYCRSFSYLISCVPAPISLRCHQSQDRTSVGDASLASDTVVDQFLKTLQWQYHYVSASSTNVPGWPTNQHDVHIHVQLHPRNCCLKLFSKAPWLKFAQHLRPPTPLYHSVRWQRRSAKLLEPECSLCPIGRGTCFPRVWDCFCISITRAHEPQRSQISV